MVLYTAWYTPEPRRVWTAHYSSSLGVPYNSDVGRRSSWASVVDGGGFDASGSIVSATVQRNDYGSGSYDYTLGQTLTSFRTREAWDASLGFGGDNAPYHTGYEDPGDPGPPDGVVDVEYEDDEATVATDQPVQARVVPRTNRSVSPDDHLDPEASFTTLQVPEDWAYMDPFPGDPDLARALLNTFVTRTQLLAEDPANRLFRDVPEPFGSEPTIDLDLPLQPADPTDTTVHFFEYPTSQESNVDPFPGSPAGWSEFFFSVREISVVIQGPRYRYTYVPSTTHPLRRRQQSAPTGSAPRRRQTISSAGTLRRGPGAAP